MPYIQYETYDSVDDYVHGYIHETSLPRPANSFVNTRLPLDVSAIELECAAIKIGAFNGHVLTTMGEIFYASMARMALDIGANGSDVLKGVDYANAEASVKTSISYLLGMTAAEIVANKIYNIDLLLHLKDSRITVRRWGTNRMSPDFFGVSTTTHEGYLLEAKGTHDQRVDNPTINGAKAQLRAVSSIIYGGTRYARTNRLNRNIIALSFYRNQQALISNIDPDEYYEYSCEVEIQNDKAMIEYYSHIYKLIYNNKKGFFSKIINNKEYYGIEMGEHFIGIYSELYDVLEKYERYYLIEDFESMIFDDKAVEGLFEKISKVLARFNTGKNYSDQSNNKFKNYYQSRDGIIVELLDYKDKDRMEDIQ